MLGSPVGSQVGPKAELRIQRRGSYLIPQGAFVNSIGGQLAQVRSPESPSQISSDINIPNGSVNRP